MSVILDMQGRTYALQFVGNSYLNNNLAIEVLYEESEAWLPYGLLTVNLPGFILEGNQAFLDTNNCPDELINWLFENNYVMMLGQFPSGYCVYPLVEFSDAFMNTILVPREEL